MKIYRAGAMLAAALILVSGPVRSADDPKVAADPEVIERFKPMGVEIRASTPAEFKEFLLKEEKRWTTLIKEQNIKPE